MFGRNDGDGTMVIKGLETFRNHFKDYNDSYVILGGTACNEWFFEADLEFRLTKDVDMVLLLEAMEETFFQHFWDYLKAGGYSRWERADGYKTVFRFVEPASEDYPYMIELLAHPQDVKVPENQKIVRLKPGEGLSSLSAILLDGAYYQLLLKHRKVNAQRIQILRVGTRFKTYSDPHFFYKRLICALAFANQSVITVL